MKAELMNLKQNVSKNIGRTGLVIQKKSPEILLAAGIVSFVGTVVLACRATLKAEEVVERHEANMKNIEDAKKIASEEPGEYEYDENLYKGDKLKVYTKTTVDFVKLYAPALAVGTLSMACFLTSRNIMNKRYLGVVAAYNAVSEAFDAYRKRVCEEAGEEMDRHYRYGTELKTIEVKTTDENGKVKKEKIQVEETDRKNIPCNDTSVIFDESNPNWDSNMNFNYSFLRGQQNRLNDVLHTRGHVFLNEVYDLLGFDMTQIGSVVGWVDGLGDGFIDFGLNKNNSANHTIKGENGSILLSFNHDGLIWDKI